MREKCVVRHSCDKSENRQIHTQYKREQADTHEKNQAHPGMNESKNKY